ncbi:uncharacterized protein LOC128558202 [Mercenaria mercenaria]|uniref:uncharacterized protein LOC128558202 n=1 Tax=Mercenaria mercenaria TaxID=6596 RepID=UPI00234E58A9|nr:uncharacterized protein LOC128558202 [Mercenaria mercenaria]
MCGILHAYISVSTPCIKVMYTVKMGKEEVFTLMETQIYPLATIMRYIFFVTVLLANGHYSEGFQIRLWPTNSRGTEGFVEAFYNGSWGFVGNPELQFTDATAAYLCKTLGLSQFGYGSGWTSIENYTGHSWLIGGLECFGNETTLDQCKGSSGWKFDNYTSQSSWGYRYGSRLYCVASLFDEGTTGHQQQSGFGKPPQQNEFVMGIVTNSKATSLFGSSVFSKQRSTDERRL